MSITRESLLEHGYKAFTQKSIKEYTDQHYQKCIRDERGKKYYITVSEWDNRQYQDRFKIDDFSYEPDVQFTDANGTTFNVEMLSPKSVGEMEKFFDSLWYAMCCEYYEGNYE